MKKYLDIIIINLVFLVIGIAIYYLGNQKVEVLAAVIATGISLSLGIRQYRTENDKIFKQLFIEFNRKYDEEFNEALEDIVSKSNSKPDYKLTNEENSLVIRYLNLCAEEYMWFRKERIPKQVWDSWCHGILYYLRNPLIGVHVKTEKAQRGSYYGFFEYIEKKI